MKNNNYVIKLIVVSLIMALNVPMTMSQIRVCGFIKNCEGEALLGASVGIQKTTQGTVSDINGFYALPIDIKTGESKLGIGFNLSNLGTKVSYDKGETSNFLPTTFRLGASYLVPFDRYNRVSVSLDFDRLLVPSRNVNATTAEKAGINITDENDSHRHLDDNNNAYWTLDEDQYNNLSVMKGLAWSFSDAPGGFAEEMKEINFALGMEYAYNEQFFARAGYHNESELKGNRKYFTVGAGFKMSAFKLDVGYVVSMVQNNPLDQTLRFSLAFDVDGIRALVDR